MNIHLNSQMSDLIYQDHKELLEAAGYSVDEQTFYISAEKSNQHIIRIRNFSDLRKHKCCMDEPIYNKLFDALISIATEQYKMNL